MSRSRCQFCTHDNPPGSRFCNECGSPLYLKPCPQCEAVTDENDRVCRKCGRAFADPVHDAPGMRDDPVPALGGQEARMEPAVAHVDAVDAAMEHEAVAERLTHVDIDVGVPMDREHDAVAERLTHVDIDVGVPMDREQDAATAAVEPHVAERVAATQGGAAAARAATAHATAHVPETFAASLAVHGDRIGDILLGSTRPPPAPPASVGNARAASRTRPRDAVLGVALVVLLGAVAYLFRHPASRVDHWIAATQLDMVTAVRASVPRLARAPDAERTSASVAGGAAASEASASAAAATGAATDISTHASEPPPAQTNAAAPANARDATAAPTNATAPANASDANVAPTNATAPANASDANVAPTSDAALARESAEAPRAGTSTTPQPPTIADTNRSRNADETSRAHASTRTAVRKRDEPRRGAGPPTPSIAATPAYEAPSNAPAYESRPPPVTGDRQCTRSVAALGLCNR